MLDLLDRSKPHTGRDMKKVFGKPYVRFAGKFLLIYFILIIVPFFSNNIYTPVMIRMSNVFFQNTGDAGFVVFSKKQINASDTRFAFTNKHKANAQNQASAVESDFSMLYRGFLPTALLTALILASPVSRKRRIYSWLAGVSLLQVFVLIKIWLQLVYHFHNHPEMDVHIFGDGITSGLLFLYRNMVVTPEPTLIVCVLIWILVTFRKSDLAVLLPGQFSPVVNQKRKPGRTE